MAAKDLITVLFPAAIALIVGYLSVFVARQYDRFLERKSIAGALAGEIGSYSEPLQQIEKIYAEWVRRGQDVKPPSIPAPKEDRIFESCASKIGLLEPDVAEAIAYFYGKITKFRTGFLLLSSDTPINQQALLKETLVTIQALINEGESLKARLKAIAKAKYGIQHPITASCIALTIIGISTLALLGVSDIEKNNPNKTLDLAMDVSAKLDNPIALPAPAKPCVDYSNALYLTHCFSISLTYGQGHTRLFSLHSFRSSPLPIQHSEPLHQSP